MNHLGLLSILTCWVGLIFLIRKWPGDGTMTFSQHAARQRESIIFYVVLWSVVLPMFYWWSMGPFAEQLKLGATYKILITIASIGMFFAAVAPETKGWKIRVHRVAAYGMAYTLCPIVLLIAAQGTVSQAARVVLWAFGLWMLAGVIRSLIEKRQHGNKTLLFQATYIALFHTCVLAAYYL